MRLERDLRSRATTTAALTLLSACVFLLAACPPQPPPAPTVTGVTLTFAPSPPFATLVSGVQSPVVTLNVVETLSNGTTRAGAGRTINFEVFPNSKGVISNFGPIKVDSPTYTAGTSPAGTITNLFLRCDAANQPVQLRARDSKFGSSSNYVKFEFLCTP